MATPTRGDDKRSNKTDLRAGVDVGGTFTDLVVVADGRMTVSKVLSTPDDPSRGVLQGLASVGVEHADAIVHGSTVATNAILERRGARTALITTAGFRDVLEIGRQDRPHLYAIEPVREPPLVPRELRREARERIDYKGETVRPLDEEDLGAVIDLLKRRRVESCAVCLLFSFMNPDHERRIGEMLRQAGFEHVSLSSEIIPEFREFERTSTVCINAYVAPIMNGYLKRLGDEAPGSLWIVQSNGGVLRADEAASEPVRTVLSGPAGGVVGALHSAGVSGFNQLVTLDMGGTSTDVTLCPGEALQTTRGAIGGFPVSIGMIDIHTVGAGGGSIASVDQGGALVVGPESAGAVPGPAAYGLGGNRPTVTDANVVLGRLPTGLRLGGALSLDYDAAEHSIESLTGRIRDVARLPREQGIMRTAEAIVELANTTMEGALRVMTVERGFDPREFVLVPFGGAGPVHACELAERLHIETILVPRYPGVLSALGCLVADRMRHYSRTVMVSAGAESLKLLESAAKSLERMATADLKAESSIPILARSLDLRYAGQSYELNVPWEERDLTGAERAFHEAHERRFTYSIRDSDVEVVAVRIAATVPSPKPLLEAQEGDPHQPDPTSVERVVFAGKSVRARIFLRDALRAAAEVEGPAVVSQSDCTTVIPPGWVGRIDPYMALILQQR